MSGAATAVSRPGPRPVTPVGILAETLERIADSAGKLDGLDPGLVADLRAARELAAGLDPYLDRLTTPESPALRDLERRTHEEDWSRRDAGEVFLEQEMLSGHVEGQLLRMLVRATKARDVLEIGMFTGYSALAMAEALPEGGRLVACELDPAVARLAQECFAASPQGHLIDVRVGPALRTLGELTEDTASFDLVFIDADKAGYADYLDALLESGLLAPGGLVCVDNTLMQGQPWLSGEPTANGAAIAAFNDKVAADPRVEQVVLPLRDGLTLIQRTPGADRA